MSKPTAKQQILAAAAAAGWTVEQVAVSEVVITKGRKRVWVEFTVPGAVSRASYSTSDHRRDRNYARSTTDRAARVLSHLV